MSKLCPKCQYFVGPPLLSSTALILLGMEFTRAAQVVAGILFHSSIMTSRSCWMLDTWCFSSFHLRMPHMCSIGFRSGDILGHSITFTFTFSSKTVIILAVCFGRLLCCKTVFEGRASSSASEPNFLLSLCRVCHVFPPLVSLFGLVYSLLPVFPVCQPCLVLPCPH